MKMKTLVPVLLLGLCLLGCRPAAEQRPLPRTIVTTDGEVDDIDSFIRLLMYSNEMDIKALVYTSSMHHWAGDGKGTPLLPQNRYEGPEKGFPRPEPVPEVSHRWIGLTWMQELIDKYEEVYPNLVRHDDRFPTADYLRSVLKVGNIVVEGDMSEPTEGSEFIKDIILEDDPSPLYVQLWGGTNTLARALLSIEEEYAGTDGWPELYSTISDKVVLNIIQDQDGTYRNYVRKNWPDIRAVYAPSTIRISSCLSRICGAARCLKTRNSISPEAGSPRTSSRGTDLSRRPISDSAAAMTSVMMTRISRIRRWWREWEER